jgi:hypothetical protein
MKVRTLIKMLEAAATEVGDDAEVITQDQDQRNTFSIESVKIKEGTILIE